MECKWPFFSLCDKLPVIGQPYVCAQKIRDRQEQWIRENWEQGKETGQ